MSNRSGACPTRHAVLDRQLENSFRQAPGRDFRQTLMERIWNSMRKRIDIHVNIEKLIPNVTPEYRRQWGVPEEHQSVGLISCDDEDAMYPALDDASKKSRIKILHAQCVFVGRDNAWHHLKQANTAIISGPMVADVKSGLAYTREYLERRSDCYQVQEEPPVSCYAGWTAQVGKYFQERFGIPAGSAYAYLVAGPMEASYALDFALKAGNTKVAHMSEVITRSNTIDAVLYGSESACRSATEAYLQAVGRYAADPFRLEV